VPIIVGIENCGKKINNAGSWIIPPPPTIESTNPAEKAKLVKKKEFED
jgi:hypothetical protein